MGDRSARREVRNPMLALPSIRALCARPDNDALIDVLRDIQRDARDRAAKCWKSHKAPMAVYWKGVSVYAGHLARAQGTVVTWAARADALIAEITADLPADADLKARRALLRGKAYWFHGGTSWGRRVWSARTRVYLARHGLPPRKGSAPLLAAAAAAQALPDDIVFPCRNQP